MQQTVCAAVQANRNSQIFWDKRIPLVVDRINSWVLEGKDIEVMFIYLSKYLGHKDSDESFYYYHLAKDGFRIVRQRDTVSTKVIPEVRRR